MSDQSSHQRGQQGSLSSSDRLLVKAARFEQYHLAGRFKHVDGLKIASDLREAAQKLAIKPLEEPSEFPADEGD